MAMPQPQSPHRPPSVDVLPGALGSPTRSSKDPHAFCTPGPLTSSLSFSPKSSKSKTTMTTGFTEQHHSSSSKDPQHRQHLSPSLVSGLGNASISVPWPSPAGYDEACALQQQSPYGSPYGSGYPTPNHFVDEHSSDLDFLPNNNLPYSTNSGLLYSGTLGSDPSCPRTYNNPGLGLSTEHRMGDMGIQQAYAPSAYLLEPPKSSHEGFESVDQKLSSNQLLQFNNDYDTRCATDSPGPAIKVEGSSVYDGGSPYGSVAGTRSSTPYDTKSGLKGEYNDDAAMDKDNQPYAQLIYRALLEAPGHTMILRDIYNWFIQNTDKAADKETKGWQNSIRHNLSMNGAFEKVGQECEDARKGFMWRLTEEAIREGVKSTTRYRSKQPHKRGHKSQQPLPQRQASGAKGGHASRRSARARKSQRNNDPYGGHHMQHRPDQYICRSVPASYEQLGFDHSSVDMSYPYSPTPSSYYGSEMDFNPSTPGNNSPLNGNLFTPNMEMNMSPYSASPMSQHSGLPYDSGYVLPQDPTEPLFYASDGSPSPSASEPSTPPDPQVDCFMDMARGMEHGYVLEEISGNYDG